MKLNIPTTVAVFPPKEKKEKKSLYKEFKRPPKADKNKKRSKP